jgi:DNA-binding beta-propeller fold protein YncE
MRNGILSLVVALAVTPTAAALASGPQAYEVWAIDQSNSPGRNYGGTLYIWNGHDLENRHRAGTARAERVDLGGAAALLCQAATGALPVRPHMLAMNPAQTHAVISFVATGHVLFVNAATRLPVACFRMSPGAGGARQAHMSTPSPDGTYVTVANQNGKLFERILTDYANGTFLHDVSATLDLRNCTTPNGVACEAVGVRPDNAPICPITESTSRFTFVTLRGGGLFVVDSRATPMQIVGEYDADTVHGNGCLGAEVRGKMYVDSGGGTTSNLYSADLYAFPVDGYSASNPPNTPSPRVVFSDESDHADAHGAALTKHRKYLWIADRGRNFVWVVDTATDEIVNTIPLAGDVSDDPTPDLMMVSPNGSHAFLSLRGPTPLTADPNVGRGLRVHRRSTRQHRQHARRGYHQGHRVGPGWRVRIRCASVERRLAGPGARRCPRAHAANPPVAVTWERAGSGPRPAGGGATVGRRGAGPQAQPSPITWMTISRVRGRVSNSSSTTCCHVPSVSWRSCTGMHTEGPTTVARAWLDPLSSPHVR